MQDRPSDAPAPAQHTASNSAETASAAMRSATGAPAALALRQAPLLAAINAALDVDDAPDAARHDELQALAREILDVLNREMTPNFWRPNRQFAQDALGASIFRRMLRAGFAATPENEERVERILVFTKANWSIVAN